MRARIARGGILALCAVSALGAVSSRHENGAMRQANHASGLQTTVNYDVNECPRSWRAHGSKHPSLAPAEGFALTKEITDIQGFHDCQRLLVDEGQRYGPLVAIFAAHDLETLDGRLESLEKSDSADPLIVRGRTSLAAALIFNLGDAYPALGINPGFSCLYMWRASSMKADWRAQIVWVKNDERRCLDTIRPPGGTGNLTVKRDIAVGFSRQQYPAVARWDWDQTTKQQYIGIKCGGAWCEVGTDSFVREDAYLATPTVQTAATQIQRIKGWYDEQLLAEPDQGEYKPSQVTGTIFPDSSLGKWTTADYSRIGDPWRPVAYIALSRHSKYYKDELNLDRTPRGAPLRSLNRLSFCLGTRAFCGVPALEIAHAPPAECDVVDSRGSPAISWWARIDPAMVGNPLFRCVSQMDHSAEVSSIPATARWHWLAKRETVWKECVTGCCQVRVLGDPPANGRVHARKASPEATPVAPAAALR